MDDHRGKVRIHTHSARVLRAFAFAIALSVFATCASAPTPKPHVETCRIIHAGPEAVWDALLQIVVAEAETVTVAQKDSGLISFRRSIPAEDVETIAFKEGRLLWSDATAHVVVVADDAGNGLTRVTIRVKIAVTARGVLDVLCYRTGYAFPESRGVLEKAYFDEMERLLAGKLIR